MSGQRYLKQSARQGDAPSNFFNRHVALLTGLLAFAILYSFSLALIAVSPFRTHLLGLLIVGIKSPLTNHSFASFLVSAASSAGYIATLLFQPLTIVAVFTAIEVWLAGPPKSWANTAKSIFYRSVMMLAQATISLLVAYIIAAKLFSPVVEISIMKGNIFVELVTTTLVILLSMIVTDFATYWAHRFEHRVKFLWRFHAVHHSIENLDAANSYGHPVDQVMTILCTGLIGALLGFSYDEFLILAGIRVIHEYLVHTRAPIHIGGLRRWIADNRYHHFHHSRKFEHYNRNFAEYFTLWDRVFGTCYIPKDDEMVETGVLGTKQAKNLWEYLSGSLESTGEDMLPPPTPAKEQAEL